MGLKSPKTINKLRDEGGLSWPSLYRLTDTLRVSISALTIRLQQLNLLYIKDRIIYSSEEEASGQIEFQF